MSTRRIHVELHAQARELAGARASDLDLEADATSADLKDALAERHPSLAALIGPCVVATDSEYLIDGAMLGAGSSFHLIPPVSGG